MPTNFAEYDNANPPPPPPEMGTSHIIVRREAGAVGKKFRKPASLHLRAEWKKRKLTTSSRICQQRDEGMQLEAEALRVLVPQDTAQAREIERRLELLGIYHETNQFEIKELQHLIETQEDNQRGYLLENPHDAGRIEFNTQRQRKWQAAKKQPKDNHLPGPDSRQVPPS